MDVYEEVQSFYENFGGEKRIIGRSAFGRELYAMLAGSGGPPLGISQAAIHGREYITAYLSLEFLRFGVKKGGVWVIPLANPDGALLSQTGLLSAPKAQRDRLLSVNGGMDFSLWKANGEGVDLNVNFAAGWGTGEKNVFSPASENYVGRYPFCAPESRALKTFTEEISPDFTVSWHTKGEELYWRFRQPPLRAARDKRIAKKLGKAICCPLKESKGSAGGYKDWCVEQMKIPAFTVEIGSEDLDHPIGKERLSEFAARYGGALRVLTESVKGGGYK